MAGACQVLFVIPIRLPRKPCFARLVSVSRYATSGVADLWTTSKAQRMHLRPTSLTICDILGNVKQLSS